MDMHKDEEIFRLMRAWMEGELGGDEGEGGFRGWLTANRPDLLPAFLLQNRPAPVPDLRPVASPQLAAWRSEANALGVPPDVQRGLMFFTGVKNGFVLDGERLTLEEKDEASRRLSDHYPGLRGDIGRKFHGRGIAGLLTEFTLMLDPSFEPRLVTGPNGSKVPSFPPPAQTFLSGFDRGLLDTMAGGIPVVRTLLYGFGRAIQEDLEGAFIAGVRFGSGTRAVDATTARLLVSNLGARIAPHMVWLENSLYHPAERLEGGGDHPQKVLGCLMTADDAPLEMFGVFSRQLSDSATGMESPEAWAERPFELLREAQEVSRWLVSQPAAASSFRAIRDSMRERGWEVRRREPPYRAVEELADEVFDRWGYDLRRPQTGLYYGEALDLRTCVLKTAAMAELMAFA